MPIIKDEITREDFATYKMDDVLIAFKNYCKNSGHTRKLVGDIVYERPEFGNYNVNVDYIKLKGIEKGGSVIIVYRALTRETVRINTGEWL